MVFLTKVSYLKQKELGARILRGVDEVMQNNKFYKLGIAAVFALILSACQSSTDDMGDGSDSGMDDMDNGSMNNGSNTGGGNASGMVMI